MTKAKYYASARNRDAVAWWWAKVQANAELRWLGKPHESWTAMVAQCPEANRW